MEPFNLEKWLKDKSRKVVTRSGRPVRIVCWDRPGFYPIIGYTEDELNLCFSTTKSGFFCKDGAHSQNDLFFADEEYGLTEFEKELINIVFKYKYWDSSKDKVKQGIKKDSKLLLDLARKELMKDLPKWKKSKPNEKHIHNKGYYITWKELETLPKEE